MYKVLTPKEDSDYVLSVVTSCDPDTVRSHVLCTPIQNFHLGCELRGWEFILQGLYYGDNINIAAYNQYTL